MELSIPQYEATVRKMHERMQAWRKANPDVTAIVQFLGTDNVIIVSPIHPALVLGLVKVNEHGYRMIRAMCEPEPDEPTIEMVKKAIHYQKEK